MKTLTHFRKRGEVAMVDVTSKAVTERTALARGFVRMSPKVLRALRQQAARQVDEAVATVQREPPPDPFKEKWCALASPHLSEMFDNPPLSDAQ